jgi:hypothetical protein
MCRLSKLVASVAALGMITTPSHAKRLGRGRNARYSIT